MHKNKKVYITEDGVKYRSTPDTTNDANIIEKFSRNQEVIMVDEPWLKVSKGGKIGWVRADLVTEISPTISPTNIDSLQFIIGKQNLSTNVNTIKLRKIINDEFGLGKAKDYLNCTEYVMYRVKNKLGITINWPVKSGRNGGKWWKIFQDAGLYKILFEPKVNCIICFTAGISTDSNINEIGHVAFVEGVLPDGSIKISEANWPREGIYNERVISKIVWQNKYKARFVQFS